MGIKVHPAQALCLLSFKAGANLRQKLRQLISGNHSIRILTQIGQFPGGELVDRPVERHGEGTVIAEAQRHVGEHPGQSPADQDQVIGLGKGIGFVTERIPGPAAGTRRLRSEPGEGLREF